MLSRSSSVSNALVLSNLIAKYWQRVPVLSRRSLISGVACLSLASLGGCSRPEHNELFSSDILPSDFPTVRAVRAMGDALREKTDGRLSVKVFPGGQLGSERDTLEITIFGGLDMNRVSAAPLNSLAPMTVVPCLPFLFRSAEHMRTSLHGAPGRVVLDSLEDHGLIGLCFYDSGARSFYNTKRPIRSPDDLQGMKLRVQSSDLYVSMIGALGANATPMFLGEVYQSLVQGVIDGAENNWPSYEAGRHYEVAQYYSLTRHVMAPEILTMSRHRWYSLSDADKQAVMESAKVSVPIMTALWDERVKSAQENILASGVAANEVDDIREFSELMKPVWERFATDPKQLEVIEAIQDIGEGMA